MVDGLASYLELSVEDARRQWHEVAGRVWKQRQGRFLPVEVLLCYALFFILDPHKYGGGNIHRVPEDVKVLADTLRRTPGSLTSKMLNLDGSRENCARLEPELFVRLAQEPAHFTELYRRVLRAARDVGLGPALVPDVLEALDGASVELLGQDELGHSELGQALHERREEQGKLREVFHLEEQQTMRLVEQRVRLGQHRFAAQVLRDYEYRCGFCGFAPRRLRHHRLLVASHIKPWARSDGSERLDPRNGIAACPTHDAAFDSGLITVNGGLRIHRAEPLRVSMVADEGTDLYFGERVLSPRLIVQPKCGPGQPYLRYHNQHVYRGQLRGV